MMGNLFNGMFGRIEHGMCRLSVNGDIAVKTSGGYKTYNMKKGTLVNCQNFVFDIGEDLFFVIPTNKVEKGDIILVGGRPKCVIDAEKNKITAIDYESSEIKMIIPERHIFLGSTYFYGKIVSMFGTTNFLKGKNGMGKMLQFMVMQELMKGFTGQNGSNSGNQNTGIMSMAPLMMLGSMNAGNMFEGMFDFGLSDDTEESDKDDSNDHEDSADDAGDDRA